MKKAYAQFKKAAMIFVLAVVTGGTMAPSVRADEPVDALNCQRTWDKRYSSRRYRRGGFVTVDPSVRRLSRPIVRRLRPVGVCPCQALGFRTIKGT